LGRQKPSLIDRLEGKSIVEIHAGGHTDLGFSFAISNTGKLWSWGRNKLGQLALGDVNDRNFPHLVQNFYPVKKLSLGAYHALCITIWNRIYGWGSNYQNCISIDADSVATVPVEITLFRKHNISDVSTGYFCSFAIEEGCIWCWGNNDYGKCVVMVC
jgi:alpha-tubulin suppressor-like RCC1 family protein